MTDDGTAELEAMLNREFRNATTEAPPEDAPEVVRDEPPQRDDTPEPPPERDTPEGQPEGEIAATPDGEPDEEVIDADTAWATKRYGDDPNQWAKAARMQEQHISRLTNEKHASDELANDWFQYAQQQEQQARQFSGQMPLSAQEEQWVESAMANPMEAARQAAFNGRVQLYQGVIARVAEENPQFAAQIGTQVQMELQAWANQQAAQAPPPPSLEQSLGQSFQRLGIDLGQVGPRMLEKVRELGEYHPYVQAILSGNDGERDLAVQAVHDLTRASTFSSRQVQRQENIDKEQELRREAMVVQTGGMAPPAPPPPPSQFQQAMEEEWKRSGAWPYPDE